MSCALDGMQRARVLIMGSCIPAPTHHGQYKRHAARSSLRTEAESTVRSMHVPTPPARCQQGRQHAEHRPESGNGQSVACTTVTPGTGSAASILRPRRTWGTATAEKQAANDGKDRGREGSFSRPIASRSSVVVSGRRERGRRRQAQALGFPERACHGASPTPER